MTDLKGILNVLDTCSFIERYSIYNWVGDERALVVGKDDNGNYTAGGAIDQKLTPAGEYYRDLHAPMAYNPLKAVVPTYQVVTPELEASYNMIHAPWKYPGRITMVNLQMNMYWSVKRMTGNLKN